MLTSVAAAGAGFALWPYQPRAAKDIPPGRIVLNYWEKWTGVEGQAVQRIVDQFNRSQDRIWVNRVPVSDIVVKSMVAIGGGDPPDLIGLFNFNIPLFAEAGAKNGQILRFSEGDPAGKTSYRKFSVSHEPISFHQSHGGHRSHERPHVKALPP